MDKNKGYLKLIVDIREELTDDKFYEILEDMKEGMRASLDVQFDIEYRVLGEVHIDPS